LQVFSKQFLFANSRPKPKSWEGIATFVSATPRCYDGTTAVFLGSSSKFHNTRGTAIDRRLFSHFEDRIVRWRRTKLFKLSANTQRIGTCLSIVVCIVCCPCLQAIRIAEV
jgi:hypothetical protein